MLERGVAEEASGIEVEHCQLVRKERAEQIGGSPIGVRFGMSKARLLSLPDRGRRPELRFASVDLYRRFGKPPAHVFSTWKLFLVEVRMGNSMRRIGRRRFSGRNPDSAQDQSANRHHHPPEGQSLHPPHPSNSL